MDTHRQNYQTAAKQTGDASEGAEIFR